jgi:UDP-N-acetylglucosamine:LPS N-acetylglucosamine transferase
VTFDISDARSKLHGEEIIPAYHPTTRNLKNLAKNFGLARRVIRDFQPDVVVSNGAAVAVPFFAVAKRRGIPTVFLEVYDRIDSRTLTGRLCHPLSTSFFVQWPEQQALYPRSINIGPLY